MDQDSTPLPQSRAAIDKLERAIARLETALGRPKADLFADQDLLTVRDGYSRLENSALQVEERLDTVVDHLKTLLKD